MAWDKPRPDEGNGVQARFNPIYRMGGKGSPLNMISARGLKLSDRVWYNAIYYSGASAREARRDAPYLRKIGNSSSRENLVMTSAYERPSELANAVRTDSGGGGGASRGKAHGGTEKCYLFSARFVGKKDSLYLLCRQTFWDVDLTFKMEFI